MFFPMKLFIYVVYYEFVTSNTKPTDGATLTFLEMARNKSRQLGQALLFLGDHIHTFLSYF